MIVRSEQGDTLDLAVWRAAGRTAGIVEAVFRANPGIAALGAVLPTGTPIEIPDAALAEASKQTDIIQLWS